MTKKEKNRQRVLNGGRGGGEAYRRLFEYYEGKVHALNGQIAELKKACDETQALLDKQIEATYKLDKENAELKRDKEDLLFIRDQRAKCMCEDKERLTYAKTIIQDLLDNTDEYARQRAEDFLKENK